MTAIPLDPALLGIKAVKASPVDAEAPSPKPSGGSGWIQTLILIAAIGAGFLWLGSRNSDPVNPPSPVPINAGGIAEQAVRDYARNLAVANETLAGAVEDGSVDDAAKIQTRSQAYMKAAREKAFAAIDRSDTDFFPEGTWTQEQRAKVAAYLREQASGFKKVAK